MDFDSGEYRALVESSQPGEEYGRGDYGRDGYDHVDRRRGGGPVAGYQAGYQPGYQPAPGYQQPAVDDYGYGDPGYADPSYDGPRDHGGYSPAPPALPALPPVPPAYPAGTGYQQPAQPGFSADPVYPVTGAQEIYRDPGEPGYPGARYDEPRYTDPGYEDYRYDQPRYEAPGYQEPGFQESGYQEPGYQEPRYGEPAYPEPGYGEPQPGDQQPGDPRLAGLRYDELRYDDAESGEQYEESRYAEPRYDEPLDDDAWYEELRRGGPAFPQRQPGPGDPGGQGGPVGPAGVGPGRFAGPSGSGGPGGPGGPVRPGGPSGPGGSGGSGGGYPQASGYWAPGNGGGAGQRTSAVPSPGKGSGPAPVMGMNRNQGPGQPAFGYQPAAGFPQASASPQAMLAAPVGVLTPPVGSRLEARIDAPQARGGSAMVGPDTVAWDAATDADELDAIEEYWQDEDDGGYSALLEEFDSDPDDPRDTGSQPAVAARRIGRRRGRSNDHRLWMGLGGVVVVAAAAIFGIVKFEFPGATGPAHALSTPAGIASYRWAPNLEKSSNLGALRNEFIKMSGGAATDVVSREYESGAVGGGNTAEIVMFVGGHVANESPSGSVAAFTQDYKAAQVVSAGPMGGEAACVQQGAGTSASMAMCAWFDNDSVGVVTSPTMNIDALAKVMREFRPSVEHVVKS
jgi:hypothetical protein